jgi:hypothetical protein
MRSATCFVCGTRYRKATDAKSFYLAYCALITAVAALVLIPGATLGLITLAVQTACCCRCHGFPAAAAL